MVRAGEPAGGDLVTQPPVELVVSLLHRKANDSTVYCQELHRILLLLGSLQAVQLHFLKQKETSPLFKPQFPTIYLGHRRSTNATYVLSQMEDSLSQMRIFYAFSAGEVLVLMRLMQWAI